LGENLTGSFCSGIGGTQDRTSGTSLADIFGVLALTPGRPTPCPIRPNKIYDPIGSHKNPSGNQSLRRRNPGRKPENLSNRSELSPMAFSLWEEAGLQITQPKMLEDLLFFEGTSRGLLIFPQERMGRYRVIQRVEANET